MTLTQQEWDALTPAQQKAHRIEEEKIVFGHDFKKVKGKPIEQGFGAPGHETPNHFAAIRKYEGEEAYQKAVAEAAKRKG